MTRPVLTKAIVNDVTPEHNAAHLALEKDYDLGAPMDCINALDPQNGILGDGSDESAALSALYADAVVDKKPLWFPRPAVAYAYGSDLLWDSNLVSVLGAGATATPFQAIGTAKIVVRPDTFTVDQGPTFRGFSVNGDPAGPAGAIGIYSGDITSARWEDLVIKGFNGTDSIGMQFDNVDAWTEVQRFRSVRLDDNTICFVASVSGGSNSFARIGWDLHFNLHANQIGFQARNDALLYGQKGYFDGNALGDDAVFVDFLGTSSMSGHVNMDFEQTSGTRAIGVREALVGFQLMADGVRNYSRTMPEDRGGGAGGGGLEVFNLVGGFRMREGVGARQGIASLVAASSVVVPTTAVKDIAEGQRIYLTRQLANPAQPRGFLEIGARVAHNPAVPGSGSFEILSMDAAGAPVAETSVIAWLITEKW